MKVTLPKEYRSCYTLEDLDRAKLVIAAEKEDEMPIKEYAEIAIAHALKGKTDSVKEVLKATAETIKNRNVSWDCYTNGSGNFDVWITAAAETYEGFIKVSAALSDIWQIGNGTDFRPRMWIQYFTEQKF